MKIFTINSMLFTIVAASSIPICAQISQNTRVVVEDPSSSLLSSKKEGCNLIFVNPDGSPAITTTGIQHTPHRAVQDPMDPPFNCTFSNASDLDLFTVIDANRDTKTWEWNSQAFLAVMNNEYQSANDYLISPGMNLKAGCFYTFSTSARAYQSQYPEKLELWVGEAPTAEGMTSCILPTQTLTQTTWTKQYADFVPEKDGVYYFAVRAVSDADQYAILINDFNISAGTSVLVPARPAIEAIRDPEGEPKATINVTTPAVTFEGKPLTGINALNIYRDGVLIHTEKNPLPSTVYTHVDNNPSVATHIYSAECTNNSGTGPKAEDSCFTGIYYAVWPAKVTPTVGDNEGQVRLDWTPCLTDQLGHPLRNDQVTYSIYRIHAGSVGLLVDGLTQPFYTDQVCDADAQQRDVQYTVMSNTSYGQSAGTGSGIFYAGAPYSLPYSESVPDGKLTSLMFSRGLANYAASWDIADINTYDLPYPSNGSDNDGGFLYHRAYNANEQACVGTGKIHIPDNASSATLSFDTFLNGTTATPNNNTLEVKVIYNGKETSIGSFTQHGDAKWATFSAELTPFIGKTIQVAWTNTVKTHVLSTLDNIRMDYVAEDPKNAVESICTENAIPTRYFNLQGIELREPLDNQIVIVRRGSTVTREVFRK